MEFPDFGEIFRSAERSTSTNNNSSLPLEIAIEIAIEKRCAKFIHSCLYNNNMIIKITSISALTTDRSQFGDTYRCICYKCKILRNSCFYQLIIYYSTLMISLSNMFVLRLQALWFENCVCSEPMWILFCLTPSCLCLLMLYVSIKLLNMLLLRMITFNYLLYTILIVYGILL